MRYDVSELMIPPKFAGLSGNVMLIYLILYMRSGRAALFLFIVTVTAFAQAPLARHKSRFDVWDGSRYYIGRHVGLLSLFIHSVTELAPVSVCFFAT